MNKPDERRREPRYEVASGSMTIGAASYACLDWSRTGFRVNATAEGPTAEGAAAKVPEPGVEFEFGLRVVAAMGRISIKGRGKIVRRTPGFIAGTWDINDPAGPNAALAATILQAFMDAGPGGA